MTGFDFIFLAFFLLLVAVVAWITWVMWNRPRRERVQVDALEAAWALSADDDLDWTNRAFGV